MKVFPRFAACFASLAAALVFVSPPTLAQTPAGTVAPAVADNIHKVLGPKINNGGKIDGIRPAPMAGFLPKCRSAPMCFTLTRRQFPVQGSLVDLERRAAISPASARRHWSPRWKPKVMPALWSGESLNDAVKLVQSKGTRRSWCLKTRTADTTKVAAELCRDGRHHCLHLHGGAAEPGFAPKRVTSGARPTASRPMTTGCCAAKAPATADKTCADPTHASLASPKITSVLARAARRLRRRQQNVGYMPAASAKLATVRRRSKPGGTLALPPDGSSVRGDLVEPHGCVARALKFAPALLSAAAGASLLLRVMVTPRFHRGHFGGMETAISLGVLPMSKPTGPRSLVSSSRRHVELKRGAHAACRCCASGPARRRGGRLQRLHQCGASRRVVGQRHDGAVAVRFIAITVSSGISFVIVTCGRSCHCS